MLVYFFLSLLQCFFIIFGCINMKLRMICYKSSQLTINIFGNIIIQIYWLIFLLCFFRGLHQIADTQIYLSTAYIKSKWRLLDYYIPKSLARWYIEAAFNSHSLTESLHLNVLDFWLINRGHNKTFKFIRPVCIINLCQFIFNNL